MMPAIRTWQLTVIDMIDAKTQEIKPANDETYTDMLELADDLPDSTPRFILLSYPLTLVCLLSDLRQTLTHL